MNLGLEIAQARRRHALTQRDLAERCGCTPTSISELERGRAYPREPQMQLAICELLGIDATALLNRITRERGARARPGTAI